MSAVEDSHDVDTKRRAGQAPVGRGIFVRTVLLSILVAVISIGALLAGVVFHERNLLRKHTEERARILATSMRGVSEAFIDEEYWDVTDHCTAMVDSSDHIVYAVMTNKKDGFSLVHQPGGLWEDKVLTGMWNPDGDAEAITLLDSGLTGSRVFHCRYPFYNKGVPWGWVHVGLSLDAHESNIREVLGIVALIALPALLLGVASSFFFARRLTRPILKLKRFAEKVAAGDLDGEAGVERRDEVGALAHAMNQMTADLKKSNKRIEESVRVEAKAREHEILIKEIHHRVKNNMQILSSLMRMQGRTTESEALKNILREGEARIFSMSLIHEKLYQSKSLSEIDFQSYVESLVSQLIQMSEMPGLELRTHIDAKGVELALDTALPCGLMINELVSNALKYAFVGRPKGRIEIHVKKVGDSEFRMSVADDGVGMPPVEERRQGSLGTRLVEMLADQLDGDIEISTSPDDGTTTTIRFFESQYANRV